jgi:hypothetical protein
VLKVGGLDDVAMISWEKLGSDYHVKMGGSR